MKKICEKLNCNTDFKTFRVRGLTLLYIPQRICFYIKGGWMRKRDLYIMWVVCYSKFIHFKYINYKDNLEFGLRQFNISLNVIKKY